MPSTNTQQSRMASIPHFLFHSFIFNFPIHFYYSLDFICLSAFDTRILNVALSIVMCMSICVSTVRLGSIGGENGIFHFCFVCRIACRCWKLLVVVTNVENLLCTCFSKFLQLNCGNCLLEKYFLWLQYQLSFVLLPCCFDQIKLQEQIQRREWMLVGLNGLKVKWV